MRRARPAFLYVMYALILWTIPMSLIAAIRPDVAIAMARGAGAYLNCHSRTALRALWHGLPRLHGCAGVGEGEGVER